MSGTSIQGLHLGLHTGSRGLRAWAASYCLPRCVSKQLNRKLSSWDSTWSFDMAAVAVTAAKGTVPPCWPHTIICLQLLVWMTAASQVGEGWAWHLASVKSAMDNVCFGALMFCSPSVACPLDKVAELGGSLRPELRGAAPLRHLSREQLTSSTEPRSEASLTYHRSRDDLSGQLMAWLQPVTLNRTAQLRCALSPDQQK